MFKNPFPGTFIAFFISAALLLLQPKPVKAACNLTAGITGSISTCAGSTEKYVSSPGTGLSYTWTVTNGTIQGSASAAEVNIVWGTQADAGTVSLKITDAGSCTATKILTVTLTGIHITTSIPDTMCVSQTLALTASSFSAQESFRWKVEGGTLSNDGKTRATIVYWDTAADYGIVSAFYHSPANCSDSVFTKKVWLKKGPLAGRILPSSLCYGKQATLKARRILPQYTYNWTDLTKPQLGSLGTDSAYTFPPLGGNRYYALKTTDTLTGCQAQDTFQIMRSGILEKITGPATICQGENVVFTNSGGNPPAFQWSAARHGTSGSFTTSFSFKASILGYDTIKVWDTASGGCDRTWVLYVQDSKVNVTAPTQVCTGALFEFRVNTNRTGGEKHTWAYPVTLQKVAEYGDTLMQFRIADPGPYTIKVTEVSGRKCGTLTFSTTLTAVATPRADYIADSTVCEGVRLPFISQSANATAYSWDFGDGKSSDSASPGHVFTQSGMHTVRLAVANKNTCFDTVSKGIWVLAAPRAKWTVNKLSGMTFKFNSDLQQDSTKIAYAWNFGDTKTSQYAHPQHTYGSAGKYTVQLKVKGSTGCTADYSGPLTVEEDTGSGVSAFLGGLNVSVYPNPFMEKLTLKLPEAPTGPLSVRLYDAAGREQYNWLVSAGDRRDLVLQTQGLPAGIYLLYLQACEKVYRATVVHKGGGS